MRLVKITLLLMCFACLVPAAKASFWYSEGEINAVLELYFQTTDVEVSSWLALDLAAIGNRRQAKMLASILGKLLAVKEKLLALQLKPLKAQKQEVLRFFNILYCKEVHDELWQQTRPLKQAAYREARSSFLAMTNESKELAVLICNLSEVNDSLRAIGRRFKEVKH